MDRWRIASAGMLVALAGLALWLSAAQTTPPALASAWELVVLGVAQDAGIPQIGCLQPTCASIRAGTRRRERVASLGLINRAAGRAYLFDATPDFVSQVHSLTGGPLPDAVFLTHGHIGHYTGLMYLGRESAAARDVPVYGTGRMLTLLRESAPWSGLVAGGHIDARLLTPDQAVDLGDGVRVTPWLVPHRDEYTDTVGYLIESAAKKAVFIPDIDQWQKWSRNIRDIAGGVDYLFLDGTFAAADEIPGRSIADIPHPLIPDTRDRLRGAGAAVWFIHLNHTNRELDAPDVARDGQRFGM